MKNYKQFYKGKKITIMGLGLLGRGLGYTKFLAECGADLIVTDLKTKEELSSSVSKLSKFKNIKFVLGEHRLEDFTNRDMIIKNAGVPFDSVYIAHARKNNIPIEMDASLFAKCIPEVTIVGITGTRGKTMTTMLIYEILKNNEKFLNKKVYLGGNVRGGSTLPLLKKVKAHDILVMELDSWQLQGFGESKISPQISVFTTFMRDHMNYYKNDMAHYFNDKANIFLHQKKGDTLVILPPIKKLLPKDIKSKILVANQKEASLFKTVIMGKHNEGNLACAIKVADVFNIPKSKIQNIVKNFKGVEGRLQYVKTFNGIKIYNDNNATTVEATIAGLEALSSVKKNIILICGGKDKGTDTTILARKINSYCKNLILLNNENTTGTHALLNQKIKIEITKVNNIKDAVSEALSKAKKGDIILFSPAFASFGMFINEYDRNDQFMKIINKLK